MDLNNENVNYLLEKMTPKCGDMIERCSWKGSLQRCDGLFQPVNSSEGYCCSFNDYAYPKWNYDPKVLSSIPKQPRRVTACGYQTGLSILLKPSEAEYFGTEVASTGFRVNIHIASLATLLHNASHLFPDDDSQLVRFLRLEFGREACTIVLGGVFEYCARYALDLFE